MFARLRPYQWQSGAKSGIDIDDFNFDEAAGLFAGLNVLPKKSFVTDYSYRTDRGHQQQLLAHWMKQLAPLLLAGLKWSQTANC